MSGFNTQTNSIKGKIVYMVLYNYSDFDYSIIKIMENLDEAYAYICSKEGHICDKFNMIKVESKKHLKDNFLDEHLNICYITSGKYNKFDLCNYCQISNYAIIHMKIN
jgi:hypothetical protein